MYIGREQWNRIHTRATLLYYNGYQNQWIETRYVGTTCFQWSALYTMLSALTILDELQLVK